MKWINKTELVLLCGKSGNTVARRLAQHKILPDENGEYASDRALAVIFAGDYDSGEGDILQPQAEKARLDRLRANKVELELQIARGEVVPMADVCAQWAQVGANVKSRMLALPTKAAPLVLGCQSLPEVKEALTDLVREALEELSATPPGYSDQPVVLPGDETSAEDDGIGMGGHVSEAKPRKRRRAGAVAD